MVVAPARHQKTPVKKTASRARAKKVAEPNLWQRHERDFSIVALFVVGLFVGLADVHTLGPVGRQISRGLSDALGVGRFGLAIILLVLGVVLVSGRVEFDQTRAVWGGAFALVTVCGLADLAGGRLGIHATIHALGDAGGWLGVGTGGALASWIGVAGSTIVLLALFVVAIIVVTGVGLRGLLVGIGTGLAATGRLFARWWTVRPRRDEESFERCRDHADPTGPRAPRCVRT